MIDWEFVEYKRRKAGVTTEELCKAMDITRCTYHRKRKGVFDTSLNEIKAIVELLRMTETEMITTFMDDFHFAPSRTYP